MADDSRSDFIREIISQQNKYIYYLLAATGACIAFAVNKTDEAVLSWSLIIWCAAVFLWGVSFYLGIRMLMRGTEYMAKVVLLDVDADPNSPRETQQLPEQEQLRKRADQNRRHKRMQLWCLLAGAVCFVIWHVVEIVLRSAELATDSLR